MFDKIDPKAGSVSMVDYGMQLDVMSTYEVCWITNLSQDIHGVQFSTYHSLLAFFDIVEPYIYCSSGGDIIFQWAV